MANKMHDDPVYWMGKQVKQTDGFTSLIGRTGTVKETLFDEKGAMHCLMLPANGDENACWWCPASMLQITGL